MTDLHDDVRDLLLRHAEHDIHPDADRAWPRVADRLEPGRRRTDVTRRAPFVLVAAALAVLLGVGAVVARGVDDDRSTHNIAGPGPATTERTTPPASVVHDLPAVWPTDSSAELDAYPRRDTLVDPVDAAREYIAARVGVSRHTTYSAFQSGDGESGEVVVGGDVATIVSLRRLGGDGTPWYVVASVSELMPAMESPAAAAHTVVVVDADGQLTIRHPGDADVTRPAAKGEELDVDGQGAFLLTLADGTTALTEVRDTRAATVP
jgi:hypothetical protein